VLEQIPHLAEADIAFSTNRSTHKMLQTPTPSPVLENTTHHEPDRDEFEATTRELAGRMAGRS
jgi:hypothetical protein